MKLRIATYNIHKCRGMDGRERPDRIAAVLREIDADIIALQEVLGPSASERVPDQVCYLAHELRGYHHVFGENRKHREAAYGNAVLSRLPIDATRNYDLTWRGCERRGCLRADVRLANDEILHVFNVHLGTAFLERRAQGRVLTANILRSVRGPRVVLGDFNEWTRGLASRLLSADLEAVDVRRFQPSARTYPGVLPMLQLDHVYYDRSLTLQHFELHKNRRSLIASDHLPMVADFRVPPAERVMPRAASHD